jgi:hypothetical protein
MQQQMAQCVVSSKANIHNSCLVWPGSVLKFLPLHSNVHIDFIMVIVTACYVLVGKTPLNATKIMTEEGKETCWA